MDTIDKKMAKKLAEYKVSRVSVSIDSMDEKIRMKLEEEKTHGEELWRVETRKNGMDPYLNITLAIIISTDHLRIIGLFKRSKL